MGSRFDDAMKKQAALNCDLFSSDAATVKAALQDGASPFCRKDGDWTPLQTAALPDRDDEICKCLVLAGLDPTEKDVMTSDGSRRKIFSKSAMEFAKEKGKMRLLEWYQAKGGIKIQST
eukprot:NODE_5676_length_563_cov_250.458661.p2 GENE.NODE_5676_length_563_cov_250.458661~~NODE_5676_length_563_cov_250.458661.p2  ORF type:complete len:119 (-),score=36.24 NODE_5676_length_563_cov_250.458661:189-545(-)